MSRRRCALFLVSLLLASVLFRAALDSPTRRHNPDEGQWAALAAFKVEEGLGMRECLWPAGQRPLHFSYYVLADRLGGHYNLFAIAALHSLLVGLTAWHLALLSSVLLGLRRPLAQLGVGLAYVALSFTLYEGENSSSEHLANVYLSGFLLVWVLGMRQEVPWLRWLGFALLGCAWMTKKQLAPLVFCAPLFWLVLPRRQKGFVPEMLGAAAGFLAPVLLLMLVFSPDVLNLGNSPHALGGGLTFAERAWKTYMRLHAHLAPVPLMLAATVAAGCAFLPRPPSPARDHLRLVAGPLLLALSATILGFHLFSHYFLMALPFAVLVCAELLRQVAASRLLRPATLAAAVALTLVVAGPPHFLSLYRGDNPSDVAISRWLQEEVPADERIFVWGWAPHLYLLSARVPASRWTNCSYIVNDMGAESLPATAPLPLAQLLVELERSVPKVVVQPLDMNWALDARRYDIRRVPRFQAYLEKHFLPPRAVHRHLVYVRRGD